MPPLSLAPAPFRRHRPLRLSRLPQLLGTVALTLFVAAVATLGACGASGSVNGGEPLFDADGGATGVSTMTTALTCGRADAGTETTWTALYRDYFGPSAPASCTGTGTACHADANSAGTAVSNFICGTSASTCFTGLNTPTAELLSSGDATHPSSSGLEFALRKKAASGDNNMPLEPSACVFTDADLARISAWIAGGAPND